MKHLDMFSGIGGFALAARWAGIETVGFSEIDKFCCKVLKKHWPDVVNYGDIEKIEELPHVDLMTGGFPCQPFSNVGKKRGKEDERYLWPQFYRTIQLSKPTWIVIENVTGAINMALETIGSDLEDQDYEVQPFVIPACSTYAPHRRERLWVVAHSNRKQCDNSWKERHFQNDLNRHLEEIHKEWAQIVPKSWENFNAQKGLGFTTDTHCFPRRKTDSRTVTESKERDSRKGPTRFDWTNKTELNWEKDKPPVCGVDDGLPQGVDRNRALGNSIVPQVVFPILRLIKVVDSL